MTESERFLALIFQPLFLTCRVVEPKLDTFDFFRIVL